MEAAERKAVTHDEVDCDGAPDDGVVDPAHASNAIKKSDASKRPAIWRKHRDGVHGDANATKARETAANQWRTERTDHVTVAISSEMMRMVASSTTAV
jgi:hypothetical protein